MIIWIASYPKSGNTWIRLFLQSYLKLNQNNIISQSFPIGDHLKKFDINYENFLEIAKNWELLQDYINLNAETNYLKTHNALCTINNFKFTSAKNTRGVIQVVRDPRDIVISYSHHLGKSHEEIVDKMLNPNSFEVSKFDNKIYNKTLLGRWNDHFNSWNSYNKIDVLLVKYEDLINNEKKAFFKILKYLNKVNNVVIDEKKLENSLNEVSFNKLKNKEKIYGFKEASEHGIFFRKGIVGDWKNNLNENLVEKIEKNFKNEMIKLGYLG